jgi:hypothetical protein
LKKVKLLKYFELHVRFASNKTMKPRKIKQMKNYFAVIFFSASTFLVRFFSKNFFDSETTGQNKFYGNFFTSKNNCYCEGKKLNGSNFASTNFNFFSMKKLNRVCNRNEKKWNVGHDLGKFNFDRKYDNFIRKIK